MQIRRYTLAMLIFVTLLGWYTFAFITQENATIDLFFFELSLPVAFWVTVPVLVFYLASLLHMLYYWVAHQFKLRHYKKDFENLLESINDTLQGKPSKELAYRTKRYQILGKLVENVSMIPNGLFRTGHEKIDRTLEKIDTIKSGEAVELKRGFDKSNALLKANQINQLISGKLKTSEVFSNAENYDDEVLKKAFSLAIESLPVYELEKQKQYMGKASLMEILQRIGVDTNKTQVDTETIIGLVNQVEMDESDFVAVAKSLSKAVLPDQRLKIFETLYDQNDMATAAYLYVLFDLEMIELADEVLSQSPDKEFMAFRAYRELKAMNKHYPIELFV